MYNVNIGQVNITEIVHIFKIIRFLPNLINHKEYTKSFNFLVYGNTQYLKYHRSSDF